MAATQERGAKFSSFLLHNLFLCYSGIMWTFKQKLSLLHQGEMNSTGSTAGLWGGRGGKGIVQ